jgi:hypothetical protein
MSSFVRGMELLLPPLEAHHFQREVALSWYREKEIGLKFGRTMVERDGWPLMLRK